MENRQYLRIANRGDKAYKYWVSETYKMDKIGFYSAKISIIAAIIAFAAMLNPCILRAETAGVFPVANLVGSGFVYENPAAGCLEEGCFNSRFTICRPAAEFTKNINFGSAAGFAAILYRILGPADGGCKVYAKYVRYPDQSIVGKKMTCVLAHGNNFFLAFENEYLKIFLGDSTCKGTLADILRPAESQ